MLAQLTDSAEEQRFYREHLTPLLGNAIGWLELQRPIAAMVRQDIHDPRRLGSGLVDFALDLPGETGAEENIRLVIELDGSQHEHAPDRQWDQHRDQLLAANGWGTRRVPAQTLRDRSLNHLPEALHQITESNPFPFTLIEDDEQAPDDPGNREATRLVLTPHAVARVQLVLCGR